MNLEVECYTVQDSRGIEGRSLGGHWESEIGTAQRKVRVRGVEIYIWKLLTTALYTGGIA